MLQMKSNMSVVRDGQSKLDLIANRIAKAHQRATTNAREWVDATLELADALLAGRNSTPANITFHDWLDERGLDFYNKTDRGALLRIGELVKTDIVAVRAVLSKTKSRSYQNIVRDNKQLFPAVKRVHARMNTAAKPSKTNKKNPTGLDLYRRAKLGDALIDSLEGTTLAPSKEQDELIRLNIGAAEGEHTKIVKQLVADAVAGKDVSALGTTHGMSRRKPPDLIQAWRTRMNASWKQSTPEKQNELLTYLLRQLTPAQRQLLEEHEHE